MSTIAAPEVQWDATKATRIPPYLKIPTGEVDVTAQGKIIEDDEGNPNIKVETWLVRRTGKALREIMDLETEIGVAHDIEIEEETEKLDAEDAARDKLEPGETLPDEQKVDIEWLANRRQARNKRSMFAVYQSLSLLLVHPVTLEHPDPEMLESNLDFIVAGEWMQVLVPRQQIVEVPVEGGDEGETKQVLESPTEAGSGEGT
jgi:hypothetical protein